MQMTSTVTSKGQVLIPALIRNKLNIKPFDRVIFDISGSKIVAEKASNTDMMYGFVKSKIKLTDKQLDQVINEATEEGMANNL
jgi:AbrB family looped-hinge helix DNA binding protein